MIQQSTPALTTRRLPEPTPARTTRWRGLLVAPLLATALVGVAAPPVHATATDPIVVDPLTVAKGKPVGAATIQGKDYVLGKVRVTFPVRPILLGKVGTDRLVQLPNRVARISATGKVTTLLRAQYTDFMLGADGKRLWSFKGHKSEWNTVRSIDPRTGRTLVEGKVHSDWFPTDSVGPKVMLLNQSVGVREWDSRTTRWPLITTRRASTVSYRAGWFAFSRPGEDGFTLHSFLAPISDPAKTVWSSWDERIVSFSPDGARMLTSDNAFRSWHRKLRLRTTTGKVLATYSTSGHFSDFRWIGNQPLMRVTKKSDETWVRCSVTACRRVTPVYDRTGGA